MILNQVTQELTRIFSKAESKHQAHHLSRVVLEQVTREPKFLTAALEAHLKRPGSLNELHYPSIALHVALTPNFTLVANCWIPHPSRTTDLSTKAIHHHGTMLLSSATIFGPGYEHWMFKLPEELDSTRELYTTELIEAAAHPLHHVAFVDAYTAHLPLFPSDLTITLALWSSRNPTTWKDYIKRLSLLKGNEGVLRKWLVRAGLRKRFELKIPEYFDFYPVADGFRGMKERQEFERGPNEDYLYSLFHILQRTGNEHLADLIRRQRQPSVARPQLVATLLDEVRTGHPIEGRLSACHLDVPHTAFTKADIQRSLSAPKQTKGKACPPIRSLGGC